MAQGKASDGRKITHRDKRLPSAEELVQIKVLTGIGYSSQGLADEFGISKDTFERWQRDLPEVSAAVQAGRAARRKRSYFCLYQQAFPVDELGRPTGKGDAGLMKYYMGCREGWKEPEKKIALKSNNDAAPVIQFAIREESKASAKKSKKKDK